MILGLPVPVFWLWFSAVVYVIAILLFLPALRREKSELMVAFFAFLAGMAIFHVFLGAGFYWNQLLLIHLGALAALTGAAYTIKFPLTALAESKRKPLFYLTLLIGWSIIAWMLIFPHQTQTMLWLVLGYMIIVSGGIAGGYILWKGFKAKESWGKVKCIGGGAGLITCCLAADLLVIFAGVSVLGEFLMALAPVILILAIYLGRYLQKVSESSQLSPAQ